MIHELKRYKTRDGMYEDFLRVGRLIAELCQKHSFHMLFAFSDRQTGWFTSGVGHDDFDTAAKHYYADSDRVAPNVVKNLSEITR